MAQTLSPKHDLSSIEASFLDAILGTGTWEGALTASASAWSAEGAALFSLNGRPPPATCSESLQESVDYYLRNGWQEHDQRYRGVALLRQQGVVTDLDFTDLSHIQRSPFYQDFLGKCGLRWFAGVKIASGSNIWCLSIQRRLKQDPFDAVEKEQLANLYPRLSKVAAIGRALSQAHEDGTIGTLDAIEAAAILLDDCGGVLSVNVAAENLFGSSMSVRNATLVFKDSSVRRQFEKALAQVFSFNATSIVSDPIAVPRENSRPLIIWLAKLNKNRNNPFGRSSAVAMIYDSNKSSILQPNILRHLWNLTAAEARVVNEIRSGHDIEITAQNLNVSKETIKSQLKSIYGKTETRSQSELLSLLSRIR